MSRKTALILIIIVSITVCFELFSPQASAAADDKKNSAAREEIVLSFMNTMNDEENETLFELIKEYGAKNPDVKIQIGRASCRERVYHPV